MINKENKGKGKLFWLDLETTGLDPETDAIMELSFVITDWSLNTLEQQTIPVKGGSMEDPFAPQAYLGDFWENNRAAYEELYQKAQDEGWDLDLLDHMLVAQVDYYFGENEPAYLAGNSIHFDRSFIKHHLPELDTRLSYRMLDVSSLKLVAENVYGLSFPKKLGHRAEADINESIAEYKFYLNQIKKNRA